MCNEKIMVVEVPVSKLLFSAGSGVTRKEAFSAYIEGFMSGVKKKRNTKYKGVDKIHFKLVR